MSHCINNRIITRDGAFLAHLLVSIMPRYQKHSRNATFRRISLVARRPVPIDVPLPGSDTAGAHLAARPLAAARPIALSSRRGAPALRRWGALVLLLILALASRPRPAFAQGTPGVPPQLYLLPVESTDVVLETHLADLRVVIGDSGPAAVMEAGYRLRNPTKHDVELQLRLAPGGDQSISSFQALSLSANGEALALEAAGDGGYLSRVYLPTDGRVLLRLVYQVGLGNNALVNLRYSPSVFNAWPGNISLRVQYIVPESVPSDAWVEISPDRWSYGVLNDLTATSIKWLFDASIPTEPFVFRFIAPAAWAQLREAQQAAVQGAPAAAFVRLGDLYRTMYAQASPEDRARFYAQAVAAYSAGLTQAAADGAPQEAAALHSGLATLYRDQVVTADAATMGDYAKLMADEATAALALLPADDSRRAELTSWQADGLNVLLAGAKERREWPQALALVEQLATLPPETVDPAWIAEERRGILVQQGLQFMAEGNRDAALALAGDQIAAEGLAPEPEAHPLFAGWQITVTATPTDLTMEAFGITSPERHAAAFAALQEVVRLWEDGTAASGDDYRFELEEVNPPQEAGSISGGHLTIQFPAAANGFLPARLLPPRVDWSLLQTVLTQLAPTAEHRNSMLWQEVTLSQPMNLRPTTDQWLGAATGLEEQAAAFETAAGAQGAQTTADAEDALRARIQAVNYRAVADEWRRLARQSRLSFTFAVDDPVLATLRETTPSRSWTVTTDSPSQMFVFQVQTLNLHRSLTLALIAVLTLLGTAGTLWWLL